MIRKLVLLPGLDGTGDLFNGFIREMPCGLEVRAIRYPNDAALSYAELMPLIARAVAGVDSYVLLAESFSTPLAIQFAAANPPGMKALALCAGFATSPLRGLPRAIAVLLAPILFRIPRLKSLDQVFLVGPDAPPYLLAAVQAATASVGADVLASRLRALLKCDTLAELKQVRMPMLYLQAASDRLVPARCFEEMKRVSQEIAIRVIDGPHFLLQREPKQAADVVAAFIA